MDTFETRVDEDRVPLVVDLDGTLIRSDLLHESAIAFIRSRPWATLTPLWWLWLGKAELKRRLALSTSVDVTTLPYEPAVLELVGSSRREGRAVVLATASHESVADKIAAHLDYFDRVIATSGSVNLAGDRKREALTAEFGIRGFDYVGNSAHDLPVWQAARRAYLVNPSSSVRRRAEAGGNVAAVIRSEDGGLTDWVGALRAHQWLKNLLIFVPLLASHQFFQPGLLVQSIVAFLCFCMCASSVYLLNDVLDMADDRHHPRKRHRALAAGKIPITHAVLAMLALLTMSVGVAVRFLPSAFVAALAVYYLLTLGYTFALKKWMIVDVVALAALYTLRIIAGAAAIGVFPSFWLLAFSVFMFLSLALVKRYAELYDGRKQGRIEMARGRGYFPDDLPMVSSLGAAAGYISVLVLALYINDPRTSELYSQPMYIWLACPLVLTWISVIWMVAHRGEMHDDPVIFALRDRTSLVIAILVAASIGAAI